VAATVDEQRINGGEGSPELQLEPAFMKQRNGET
jgi:hypothetical protein